MNYDADYPDNEQIPAPVCLYLRVPQQALGIYRANALVEADKGGDQECLRFPPFHQEMLTQNWWSAGEDIGRVKVVISEGLASAQGPPSGFRRVKNIVSFSFQHAPLGKFGPNTSRHSQFSKWYLAILEEAGIAWPNAGMWYHQPSQQLYVPASPGKHGAMDPDAHAHSPRSRNTSGGFNRNAAAAVVAPRLLSQVSMPPPTRRSDMMTDSSWTSAPMQDPFVEDYGHRAPRSWGTRVSSSDASMPDYSHSITPRSSRHPSLRDMDNAHSELNAGLQHNSQFEELLAIYSPADTNGTQAPPTTRVSSASNTPPKNLRNPSTLEARAASFHSQPRAVSMTIHDAPLRSIRDPSDISMQSRFSEAQASDVEHAHTKIVRTPAGDVKGRKEGKISEPDLLAPTGYRKAPTGSSGPRKKSMTQPSEEHVAFTNDGKRKRASVASISNLVSEKPEDLGPSPSRKISKKGPKDDLKNSTGGPATQESIDRTPLGSLENIQ